MARSSFDVMAALGLAAISVVVGAFIGAERLLVPSLVLGAVGLAVLARTPRLLYLAVLFSVAGFVSVYAWPRFSFLPGGLYVSELLLLAAVIASFPSLVAGVKNGAIRPDAIWVFVGLLSAACVGGVAVGVLNGAEADVAAGQLRPMIFLLGLIPAAVAVSSESARRVVILGGAWLAFAVSVAAFLQFLLGAEPLIFVIGSFEALIRSDPSTGILRVRPPGLYLVYASAVWASCYTLWGPAGRGRLVAAALLAANVGCVVLSFNRNMAVGLVAALAVAAVFSRQRARTGLLGLLAAVTLLGGVLVFDSMELQQPLVARFASLLDPEERGQALSDRAYETAAALSAVLREPVLGLGWGPGYGASATRLGGANVSTFERPWIHNQFLGMWVRAGLLGVVSLIAIFALGILTSIRNARAAPLDGEWVDLALLGSLVAFGLSSVVDIVVLNPNNLTVLLGLIAIVSARRVACALEAGEAQ